MAFTEKTASGVYRLREASRINGRKFTVDIIKDLGTEPLDAEQAQAAYHKAKSLGYVWNPNSAHVLADIQHFLKAKSLGVDPSAPAMNAILARNSWLEATTLDSKTLDKYRGATDDYFAFTKIKVLDDMTVETVNQWRIAMADGKLTYTRGGKLANGQRKSYLYSATSISIKLKDLRTFCNYCIKRGWMTNEPANKTKPLNPFSQIEVAEAKRVKRFLTRIEAARFLKAARIDRYKAGGNKPIPEPLRKAIIDFALKRPELGKWKVRRLLEKKGYDIGVGTVDWVWRRNGLVSQRQRRRAATRPFVPATTYIDNPKANSKARRWLHLELYTGLREGEARRARCEDIMTHDVVDKDGKLRRVYGLSVLQPSKGGDDKVRIIWFPPNAARIHGIVKRYGKKGPLLPPMSKSNLARARNNAVKRASLGKVRSHDMRHSFARNFLLSGAGKLPQLQQTLGHARLSTTGIYSNFANIDLAEAANSYKVK